MAGFKTVDDARELMRLADELRFTIGTPGGLDYVDDHSVELSLLFEDLVTDDTDFSWSGSLTECLAFLQGVRVSYVIDEDEYKLSTQESRREVVDELRKQRKHEEQLKQQAQMVDIIRTGKMRRQRWH